MTDLITYHGDHALKAAFLAEISKHEAADALVKGTYGRMNGAFKGCAIGCSLYSLNVLHGESPADAAQRTGDHDRIPTELGWPLWLAYAEDTIFERLPTDLSKTWPRRLAEAVPVGVTVPDIVLAKVFHWTLMNARFGVINCADAESTKDAVRKMGALFERTIAGENVPGAEWNEAAARAAWDARDARDAWDARDALSVQYAARCGWIASAPDLLTVGLRDAYAHGLGVAVPVAPNVLGWAMSDG